MLVWLVTLVRLRTRSQHRLFPFSCWPRERFRKEQRIHTSQVIQSEKLSFRSNKRALCYEEFLNTKINNKNVYLDHGATEDIPENACSFRRQYYGWTALN